MYTIFDKHNTLKHDASGNIHPDSLVIRGAVRRGGGVDTMELGDTYQTLIVRSLQSLTFTKQFQLNRLHPKTWGAMGIVGAHTPDDLYRAR